MSAQVGRTARVYVDWMGLLADALHVRYPVCDREHLHVRAEPYRDPMDTWDVQR